MSLTLIQPLSMEALNDRGAAKETSAPANSSWAVCIRSTKAEGPKRDSLDETDVVNWPKGFCT